MKRLPILIMLLVLVGSRADAVKMVRIRESGNAVIKRFPFTKNRSEWSSRYDITRPQSIPEFESLFEPDFYRLFEHQYSGPGWRPLGR